jgi:hypothetical protein
MYARLGKEGVVLMSLEEIREERKHVESTKSYIGERGEE